jgi:hypothetical protein
MNPARINPARMKRDNPGTGPILSRGTTAADGARPQAIGRRGLVWGMTMKAAGSLVLILALAGCQSTPGGARQETERWTVRYDVPYDIMARCLESNAVEPLAPAPQVSRQDGTVRIVLAQAGLPNPVPEQFTVRRLSDRQSAVDWQNSQLPGKGGYLGNWAHNVADRCAKDYAEFGPGSYSLSH